MIELFDAARLQPRRDHSLPLAVGAVLLAVGGVGAYGFNLHSRLADAERERAALQLQVKQVQARPAPSATLLADLQREVDRLEVETRADPQQVVSSGPRPSQWLIRLGDLGSADISMTKVEVDHLGAVRIEGMAASPQAVSRFLQQWDHAQPAATPVPARAIDVRQDPAQAPLLGFKLRAAAPPAAPAAAESTNASPKART
jgi:hypothetical protein